MVTVFCPRGREADAELLAIELRSLGLDCMVAQDDVPELGVYPMPGCDGDRKCRCPECQALRRWEERFAEDVLRDIELDW